MPIGDLTQKANKFFNEENMSKQYDYSNPDLTVFARRLRKTMTDEERKLWYECLKELPWRFHRQKVISRFVVDFYCAEKKTAIEVDGSQHYEEANEIKDNERTLFLQGLGVTVLRYTNREIKDNFRGVCDDIYEKLSAK